MHLFLTGLPDADEGVPSACSQDEAVWVELGACVADLHRWVRHLHAPQPHSRHSHTSLAHTGYTAFPPHQGDTRSRAVPESHLSVRMGIQSMEVSEMVSWGPLVPVCSMWLSLCRRRPRFCPGRQSRSSCQLHAASKP